MSGILLRAYFRNQFEMNENELIKLILQGESDKFRIFVEKYRQMVFRTCMGFVHNKEDADDLTQEVFIQAYR